MKINTKDIVLPKDNSERARALIITFYAFIGLLVIALISGYMELNLLTRIQNGFVPDSDTISFNDNRQAVIGIIQTGAYIFTIVIFLNWFRRAYGNLKRLDIKTDHSETMSIWAFFIPIISLYRPMRIMKEIWMKTQLAIRYLDSNYISRKNVSLIGIWWTLFIATNILGNYTFRKSLRSETIEEFISVSQIQIFSDFLQIIEAFLVILIVKRMAVIEQKLYQTIEIETIST